MASELTVLPVFDPNEESKTTPEKQQWVWRPEVEPNDFIIRYGDSIADMANHGGATITSFVRWGLLTIGCIGLLVADAAARLDKFIQREAKNMGVTRDARQVEPVKAEVPPCQS